LGRDQEHALIASQVVIRNVSERESEVNAGKRFRGDTMLRKISLDERQALPKWLDFPAQGFDELRNLVESSYFLAR
jgi:hypothetical protein